MTIATILTLASFALGWGLRIYDRWAKAQETAARASADADQATAAQARRLTARQWMEIAVSSAEEEAKANPELVEKANGKLAFAIGQFRAKHPEFTDLEARVLATGVLGDLGLGATGKE